MSIDFMNSLCKKNKLSKIFDKNDKKGSAEGTVCLMSLS